MEVKRFSEATKNWTNQKIKNFLGDKRFIEGLLVIYLQIKIGEFFKNYYGNQVAAEYDIKDFFFNVSDEFVISYSDDSGSTKLYRVKDFDEMIQIINNPELYKKSIKYNI